MNPFTIYLANLTHVRKGYISTEIIPLNIGFLASYLLKIFGDKIAVSLFNLPKQLEDLMQSRVPDLLGVSNYAWNSNLNYHYASYYKSKYPKMITLMGGPHFPGLSDLQEGFLRKRDKLDFYIYGDGELPIAELVEVLLDNRGTNSFQVKKTLKPASGLLYINNEEFANNGKAERLTDVDQIPSPYLTGLFDEMLSEKLTPIIQTNRGCPFTCAYCHTSNSYYSKVYKFPLDRVKEELRYIHSRTKTDGIFLTDDNLGLFEQDIEIAETLANFHDEHGWPRMAIIENSKTNRERVLNISLSLKDIRPYKICLQSTNSKTLKEIKRINFSLEEYFDTLSTLNETGKSYNSLIRW